jgi:L-rhamnose isomerase/sugar isomerase
MALMAPLQQSCSLVEAEETLRGAFWYDARPSIREWRRSHGLPELPGKWIPGSATRFH